MSYGDDYEYDDFEQSHAPEYDYDCEECGAPSMNEVCAGCTNPDHWADDRDSGIDFADPGGNSALRAATYDNPRNLPCPNCGTENVLTPADRQRGYQCDSCADRAEGGMEY